VPPLFDTIPIPFLKYACLPVECDGRARSVNVLVHLMARLFRAMLREARVPTCWKIAKLSPPRNKKGAVLDPGNYRMIAVIGAMHRIFDNVLTL